MIGLYGFRAALSTALIAAATPGAAAQSQARGTATSTEIVTVTSAVSFDSTLGRLERAATAKGLAVAAKIDHSAAAKRAGMTLRPTTLVIAGNPAAGTPLMQAEPTMAVELPLRFLVWQGDDGRTRVSYDPIKSIAERHRVTGRDDLVSRMMSAIEDIVRTATQP